MRFSLIAALTLTIPALAQDDWHVQRLVAINKYPTLPRMAFVQGVVNLRCSIAQDGRVADCRIDSGHPLLSPIAIENVKLWTFRRTSDNGGASSEIQIIYTLELAGAPTRSPNTEFSFEFPNRVRLVSQPACADRAVYARRGTAMARGCEE